MKVIIQFLCLLCFGRLCAEEQTVAYTFKTGIASEYLGAIGPVFYKQPVAVSEMSVGYGDWYVGVWNSTGLGGTAYGKTYGDEFDLYAGWAHRFGPVKVDVSSSYYAVASLDTMKDDVWVVESILSVPTFPFVEPYIHVRYFGQVGSESPQTGFFWFAGIRKYVSLCDGFADRPVTLMLQASTAYAAGALKDSTGFVYGRLTSALDIPLSKKWTMSPEVVYQIAAPGQRSDPFGFTDGNKLVFKLSVRCNF